MSQIEDHVRRLRSDDEEFVFELKCKRSQELGPITIDQWWMPITPLYGQRTAVGPVHNHREIVRCFWAAIRSQGAESDRVIQEKLLLAALVPDVRSQGSRTIFDDAFLRRTTSESVNADAASLEKLLVQSADQRCSREEFHERSWKLLGCPEFPDGTAESYAELASGLFDGPAALLAEGQFGQAVEAAVANWNKAIGRRHFKEQKRAALDALSYESRAAFHEAYSVTWLGLLYAMNQLGDLTPEAARFHHFWHTDRRDAVHGTSLFHGHVFGLHPALGPLVVTGTGRRLIGNWLEQPQSEEAFQKLLYAGLLSLHGYGDTRNDQRQKRREGPLKNQRSEAARGAIETAERNKASRKKR